MADGGERLREVVERERRLDRWTDVLPLYGELQLDIAEHADRLVALGTPERGLATLASEYERLIGETDGLTPDELARLTDLVPEVAEMCRRLAEVGIPETVQHDDLHDGQVFVRDGGYLFFDWGDSCVSHPFFTMSVTLEGVSRGGSTTWRAPSTSPLSATPTSPRSPSTGRATSSRPRTRPRCVSAGSAAR